MKTVQIKLRLFPGEVYCKRCGTKLHNAESRFNGIGKHCDKKTKKPKTRIQALCDNLVDRWRKE